ncbi:hypothetical protein E3J59_06055 [Candidatus Aerophobetes bacterium]|uniref:DUF3575 domain-containing protein n=1 Tax=Aerophobetes bacterium TaxID=2030807 RepID=A0A523UM89_UNCAE|nr:MAG: hypothetical protein E3J59_06055 [Candidatus Aerophobetes bacterium]
MRKKRGMAKAGAILVIFLLLTGTTQIVCSQEARAEKGFGSVISVNPFGLLFGIANAEYEKVWKPNMSLIGQGLFSFRSSGNWKWSIFGGGVGIKRYLNPTAPEKLWFGGNVNLQYVSAEYWGGKDSSIFLGLTGLAGYKWIFGQFTVEPSVGLGISIGSLSIGGESVPLAGVGPAVGFNLGYAF